MINTITTNPLKYKEQCMYAHICKLSKRVSDLHIVRHWYMKKSIAIIILRFIIISIIIIIITNALPYPVY